MQGGPSLGTGIKLQQKLCKRTGCSLAPLCTWSLDITSAQLFAPALAIGLRCSSHHSKTVLAPQHPRSHSHISAVVFADKEGSGDEQPWQTPWVWD